MQLNGAQMAKGQIPGKSTQKLRLFIGRSIKAEKIVLLIHTLKWVMFVYVTKLLSLFKRSFNDTLTRGHWTRTVVFKRHLEGSENLKNRNNIPGSIVK